MKNLPSITKTVGGLKKPFTEKFNDWLHPVRVIDVHGGRSIIPQAAGQVNTVRIHFAPIRGVPNAYVRDYKDIILVYQITEIPKIQSLMIPKIMLEIHKNVLSELGYLKQQQVILNDRTISYKEGIEILPAVEKANRRKVNEDEERNPMNDETEEIPATLTFIFHVGYVGLNKDVIGKRAKSVGSIMKRYFGYMEKHAKSLNPFGPISVIWPNQPNILILKPVERVMLDIVDGIPKILRKGTFIGYCANTGKKIYVPDFTEDSKDATNGITIVSGGPGKGKTTFLRNFSESISEELLVIDPGGREVKGNGGWDDPNFIQYHLVENDVIDPFTLPHKSDAARRAMIRVLLRLMDINLKGFANGEILRRLEPFIRNQPRNIYEFRDRIREAQDPVFKTLLERLDMLTVPFGDGKALYEFKPLVGIKGKESIPFSVSGRAKHYINLDGCLAMGANVAILLAYVIEQMTPDRETASQVLSVIFEEAIRFAENAKSDVFPEKVVEEIIHECLEDISKNSRKKGVRGLISFHSFVEAKKNAKVAEWVERLYGLAALTVDYDEFAPNVTENLKKWLKASNKTDRYAIVNVIGMPTPLAVKISLNRPQRLITHEELRCIRDNPGNDGIVAGPLTSLLMKQGYDQFVPRMDTSKPPVNVKKADMFEDTEKAFARRIIATFNSGKVSLEGKDLFQITGEKRITAITLDGTFAELQHVRNRSDFFYFGMQESPLVEKCQIIPDIFSLLDFLKKESLSMEELVSAHPALYPYVFEPKVQSEEGGKESDELWL